MIAFVGKQHVRMFEREYEHAHADLWAFGHRKRKSQRLNFGHNVFNTFRVNSYKQMLLLHELHHVPLMYSDSVVEYKLANKTIASLWPVLSEYPPTGVSPESWYNETVGDIVIIHL
tara:strand:- start:1386 stop:1733 length:348 start_codon:yes stop_codon:yes gene_type:complete